MAIQACLFRTGRGVASDAARRYRRLLRNEDRQGQAAKGWPKQTGRLIRGNLASSIMFYHSANHQKPDERMTKTAILLTSALVLFPCFGVAGELSAVCAEPYGGQYRYQAGGGEPQFMNDGFKAATWSFFWNSNKPSEGLAVVQHSKSAGATVERQPAMAVTNSLPDFITFIVPLKGAMWVYSVYPLNQVMFASRHGNGFDGEAGVGGLFKARCKVSWEEQK